MHHATSAQVQNAGWNLKNLAFPVRRANYICSENSVYFVVIKVFKNMFLLFVNKVVIISCRMPEGISAMLVESL